MDKAYNINDIILILGSQKIYTKKQLKNIFELFKCINKAWSDIIIYNSIKIEKIIVSKQLKYDLKTQKLNLIGIIYNKYTDWKNIYSCLDNKYLLIYNDNFDEYSHMSLNKFSGGNGPLRQYRSDIIIDTEQINASLKKKDKCFVLGIPTSATRINKIGVDMAIIIIINFIIHFKIQNLYFYVDSNNYRLGNGIFDENKYVSKKFIPMICSFFKTTKFVFDILNESNYDDDTIYRLDNLL